MRKTAQLLFIFVILFFFATKNVFAQETACSVSVSPVSTYTSTYTSFSFQITNTGTNDINWVAITPDENFSD